MKKILTLLSIFIFSCKKNEPTLSTGSIAVSVRFLGQTLPDVEISTEPPTTTATTNIEGAATLIK